MFSSFSTLALVASWLLVQVNADTTSSSSSVISIATPTTTLPMNALTSAGCYSTATPLVDHGAYLFQSSGNCQGICYELGNTVMGLVNGTNCYCGNLLPPTADQVGDGNCSTPCAGIDTDTCGGGNYWLIYLTGITKNKIAHLDPSSAATTTAVTTTSSDASPATVVVTASSDAQKSSGGGGGTSKVGIAVGVVVGIVAILGIAAGVFFFLRHKRRRGAEEEYKRQAAVNSFVNGGKGHNSTPSLNDSRLDPDMLARRESTGTINDTQDYSRRILKIRNPDGF